jgi:hypothetical protein
MVAYFALTKRIWRVNRNVTIFVCMPWEKALVCLMMIGQGDHHHIIRREDKLSSQNKIPVLSEISQFFGFNCCEFTLSRTQYLGQFILAQRVRPLDEYRDI